MHPISFLLAAVLAFAVPTHTLIDAGATLTRALSHAGPRWV